MSEIDKKTFVAEVKKQFSKVSPSWKPPYKTAIAVAKKLKYQIQINGKSSEFWSKRIDHLFDYDPDKFDAQMDIVLSKNKDKQSLSLLWTDVRKLKESK